ncbi:chemotaxis protein CheW [Thalassoroseus pseudoceratinae]|uniref:chemotaxis protein CheW n=1 Tax=Thalassoroseus pseudoceratinae TaxID=2713176 RepID=UPI00141F4E7D|nr:chemotaxis protein CheW [Thalassoroseus pseudoceratinae]
MTTTAPTVPSSNTTSHVSQQYVTFRVADDLYGVPVTVVQEVLNPQRIAKTPKAPPDIAGLLNLRGQIVTAVDLRTYFDLAPLEGDKEPMNVVVRYRDEWFSLLVDEVGEVVDVGKTRMDPVPHSLAASRRGVLRGVLRLEDALLVVLDISCILDRRKG